MRADEELRVFTELLFNIGEEKVISDSCGREGVIGDYSIAHKPLDRAPDRVVFHIADENVVTRPKDTLYYQVETVGAAWDEDDALFVWRVYE